ncbi:hypothetical protein RI543_001153 [Arxiozyma heterogenica]|uniref:Polynucleotide 5'-hydroxyl-kinase GRC3 n=1 Tax=Arxiozyma heterogenica TaxID=278026 RepID=A0AAN7WIK1_9SACH|nr:hypothetical protein RI543_001153 [Kazachstania heterogenica]
MDLPKYESIKSDSENDDSDASSTSSSTFLSRESTVKVDIEDYESDENSKDSKSNTADFESHIFIPIINGNIFNISNDPESFYLGLKEKQQLFISGIFDLQILKGGIVYNNIHYNASNKQTLNIWHPLSCSVPAIISSFYAGWNEPEFHKKSLNNIPLLNTDSFICIIKITNNKKFNGITDVNKLNSDLNFLWKPKTQSIYNTNSCSTSEFLKLSKTFTILNINQDIFTPLTISSQWRNVLERLYFEHINSHLDTRIMIIGGKNSGKSTFLRLLTEKILNTESNKGPDFIDNDRLVWYMDLDPGQPEYSNPECVSLGQIKKHKNITTLGTTFGQCGYTPLRQHFVGVNSPQENPELYLSLIDNLFNFFEEQYFTGTSLLNLPGWIKGFGIHIINHVIKKYKPTHLLILEHTGKSNFEEIFIPESFNSNLRENYFSTIIRLLPHQSVSTNSDSYNQLKFQSSQLRIFRMLLLFHKQFQKDSEFFDFDFKPLLSHAPLQISIDKDSCISGIYFMEEFQQLHKDDIKNCLETCIVGIHKYINNDDMDTKLSNITELRGIYPIIKGKRNSKNFQYVTLGLIHSIDEEQKVINMYIPEIFLDTLKNDTDDSQWIIARGKTETPICELYPSKKYMTECFSADTRTIPYISTERAKKHEHVWKIRKNIHRRGHYMK